MDGNEPDAETRKTLIGKGSRRCKV